MAQGERKDKASEEELITKDEEYISKLDLKAHKAMDVHIEYEKSFARNEKAKSDRLKTGVAH